MAFISLSEEPVRTAILGFVSAGIVLLIAFGVALSAVQIAAITGFVAAVIAVAELVVRKRVTPLADPQTNDGRQLVPIRVAERSGVLDTDPDLQPTR